MRVKFVWQDSFFSRVLLIMTGSAIMAWSRGNGDGHLQKAEARKLRLLV
jgi:hypothetical protein